MFLRNYNSTHPFHFKHHEAHVKRHSAKREASYRRPLECSKIRALTGPRILIPLDTDLGQDPIPKGAAAVAIEQASQSEPNASWSTRSAAELERPASQEPETQMDFS